MNANDGDRGLRGRMLREWLLLAGVLALLAALMAYGLAREYRRVDASESARLQTQAQVVELHVRRQLESVDQALRTMLQAAAGWPQPAGPAGAAALHTLAAVMPGVRTLAVMDGRGLVFAANRPELLGRNYRDRDYFRNALAAPQADMLFLSAPFRSYLGSVALNIARVLPAPGGGVARLAVATLDPEYFGGMLGSVTYAPDMWAAVLHGDGLLFQIAPLTASDAAADLQATASFWRRHADADAVHSLVLDEAGATPARVAVRTVGSTRSQSDHPLVVAVGRSLDGMHAPIWQQARAYGLLLAATGLSTCLGLWLLQRRRMQVAVLQHAQRAARRDGEERVARALRGADLGLWEWDLGSGRMVLDARGCSMLGLTPAQMQLDGRPWRAWLHPEDAPRVLADAAALAQRSALRFESEFRVRHADGHWIWLLARGDRIESDRARLTGTHMDITARREAAQALAAREAELRDFRNMLDETLDCVFIFDAQTLQFIYVNEGAIRLTGHAKAALLGMTPTDLLWDTTTAQYRERTRPLVEGREASQLVEVVHRHRDGQPIPVEVFLQYLPATAERTARFLAVVRDISARHAASALRLSEARFRLLIEDAPTAIAILRGDRFDYTNQRFVAMHGYAAGAELAGAPWRAAFAVDAHAALANGQAAPTKTHSVHRDGRLLPVLVASTTVELSDGPATVAYLQDISALEQAQAELEQARDAAEQASRAKAAFVANMSHEVRTPLNAILGLAYLLEHGTLRGEPLALVRKIHSAGRTLLGIINHVLDISKIEAGRLEVEHAPMRLEEVIDNVATIMGVNAGDKALELVITPVPLGAGQLMGDALRLQQVLVNLTGNAIKFTDRGQVALRTQLLHRDSRRILLRFSVTDTGIGIAPDQVEGIFSPFAQADSSTTRRFGGTGLGLAICRQLVELMGGEIGVNSTPGQGSEFWFTVPFEPAPPAHFSSPAMLQVRALLADDSDVVREAAVATAQALGWQIDAVASGRAALEFVGRQAAQQSLPDVVLLDWRMPGMDGLAAARAIRASVPADACPIVIMVTAHARSQLLQEAGEGLVDAVLDKPLTSSKLYDAVVQAQRHRGMGSEAPAPAPLPAGQQLAGLRVLVVDDSEINREVAQRILAREGAVVQLAGDGQQALQALEQRDAPDGAGVDIVLMDVQMPVMDGIEATRHIRRQPHLARLPVVALTAGAFKSQQDAAWAAGMNGFIGKPFDVAHAIALIRRLTGRNGAPAERAPDAPPRSAPPPPDLPGIDLAQGLQIWTDERAYRRFLVRFLDAHGQAAEEVGALLAAGEPSRASDLVHRLRGGAAHLALPPIVAAARDIEEALAQDRMPDAALHQLALALQTVRASAAQLATHQPVAPPDALSPAPAAPTQDGQVRALLQALLQALDTDDPAPAEPLLAALAPWLPAAKLQALQAHVDGYDFRGAEQQVRRLLDAH